MNRIFSVLIVLMMFLLTACGDANSPMSYVPDNINEKLVVKAESDRSEETEEFTEFEEKGLGEFAELQSLEILVHSVPVSLSTHVMNINSDEIPKGIFLTEDGGSFEN